jgi:hypothetical protein
VSCSSDGAEGPIGVEETKRIVRGVHNLLRGDEIGDDRRGEVGEQTEEKSMSQVSHQREDDWDNGRRDRRVRGGG